MNKLILYLELARPNNWIKNLLIVPGFLLAYLITPVQNSHLAEKFFIGFLAICLVCSANYVINEWLDRDFDKFHPSKNKRVSVLYSLRGRYIFFEYSLLAIVGIILSLFISIPFLIANIVLLLMGIVYNLEPIRTKDIAFLDVITESINNPIRLFLGWFIVASTPLPPISLVLSYWMAGGFVMGVKRYSELQFIEEPTTASKYRRSFENYSAETILVSSFFYATCAAFFWSAFIISYKMELLLLSPLYALLFAWYLLIGLKPNSIAQHPECIYKEKLFSFCAVFVALLTLFILFLDVK